MIQTQPWRTFSIFISSTFADMQAERDHLKDFIFPNVEEELRKKRILLEVVDLRWGVDTASVNESEREATVLKVCLDEIRRCKPFFIGLLGDRYGWVPPEERMKNATLGEKLILPAKGKSVTALEIEFGALADKEQLSRSVFYFRERLPYEEFTQEKAAKYCDEFDPELSDEDKAERKKNLDAIKTAIKAHFDEVNHPEKVKNYPAKWDKEKHRIFGLEEWRAQVTKDILKECANHASDTWNEVPKNQHEEQLALLDAFIESHTHVTAVTTPAGEVKVENFCGREKLLGELRQFLMSLEKGNAGIVLTGESGSGKSAVFAMVCRMMQKEDCLVLAHSAGISPDARSVLGLLQGWNKQLSDFLQLPQEEDTITKNDDWLRLLGMEDKEKTKTGIEKLQQRFAELLSMAAAMTRIILLVDALDSFEPTERAIYMTWLPGALPANARLLVTAITGTEKKAVQFHKDLTTRSLDYFTHEEAAGMLQSLCQRQHKNLSPLIKQKILSKMRSDGLMAPSSPLWLSLAVNNLMAIDADDFEKMSGQKGRGDEQIESYLEEMANGFKAQPGELFLQLVERARRIFGVEFTQTIFNAIACSRGGLRESDLEALVNASPGNKWDALQFANLRRWFKAQFKEQGEGKQWNLAHSILRNTLKEKMDSGEYNDVNVSIANHLLSLPADGALCISETMYHLMQEDDKMPAIVYYSSELGEEALAAATKVLAEIVTRDENGLETVASFPGLIADHKDGLPVLLKRFVFALNNFLAEEGNLDQRLKLLSSLNGTLEKSYGDQIPAEDFGFHKTELYEKLGDIHQAMGHMEEALNYFDIEGRLFKDLTDANPHSGLLKHGLAVFFEKLGDIQQAMGHEELALYYFELFNKFLKELINSNPRDESFKIGLATSYERLGFLNQETGHMQEALDYFVLYNKLCKELYDADPYNELSKRGLAISYEKLGEMHQMIGHIEETLKYFEMCYKLYKELYDANPRNVSLKKDLAMIYEKLGSIHQAIGHMQEALNYFEISNKFCVELTDANIDNVSIKDALMVSYSKLGNIHLAMGHMKEALNYFEMYNKFAKELYNYNTNPRNESYKDGLTISYLKLGYIQQAMGHIEEALNYFEKGLKLAEELYNVNPLNKSHKDGLAISYERLGSIHQVMGHLEEALNYFELHNKFCKELYNVNPHNEALKNDLSVSFGKLAEIHLRMGHMEEALNYFEKDLKLREELYDVNLKNESRKYGLVALYERLGYINHEMGQMKKAINYFELHNKFCIELYEANPYNIQLLEALDISYYKLATIYKAVGNNTSAEASFSQFKNIISGLAKNFPQVPKYNDWNKLEYDLM